MLKEKYVSTNQNQPVKTYFLPIADSRFSHVFTQAFRRTDIGFVFGYVVTMETELSHSFLVRSRLECMNLCWGSANCTGAIYTEALFCWIIFPKLVVLPW